MGAGSPSDLEERYEKALRRIELLTYAIVAMSVILLIILI